MNKETIISTIENFLTKMTADFDSIEVVDNGLSKTFLIKTKDAGMLIGNRGETLDAISFLIRRIVEKDSDRDNREVFVVDINNYQTKKLEDFLKGVKLSADKVRLFKQNVELSPMTSYERMLVHTTFSEDKDIKTESEGEGKFRRIVLKHTSGTQYTNDGLDDSDNF